MKILIYKIAYQGYFKYPSFIENNVKHTSLLQIIKSFIQM